MKLKKSTVEKNSFFIPAGDVIFEENDPGTEMYLIISGDVEIYRKAKNSQKVLMVLKPGAIFGEMALVDKLPRSASARAKTDTQLMVIRDSQWEQIFIQNSEFSVNVVKILSRRLREANRIISDLLTKDKSKQVFGGIIEYSRNFSQKTFKGYIIDVDIFVEWAVSHIGIDRDEILNILSHLTNEKILEEGTSHPNSLIYDPKIQNIR